MKLRSQSGFTLIELFAVVAIIGILATMAISNFFFAKRNAQNAAAASTMRSLLPALDVASSSAPPVIYSDPFGPGGGPIDVAFPEARNTEGVAGFIEVSANDYRIEAYHVNGTVCYVYDSAQASTYSATGIEDCTT